VHGAGRHSEVLTDFGQRQTLLIQPRGRSYVSCVQPVPSQSQAGPPEKLRCCHPVNAKRLTQLVHGPTRAVPNDQGFRLGGRQASSSSTGFVLGDRPRSSRICAVTSDDRRCIPHAPLTIRPRQQLPQLHQRSRMRTTPDKIIVGVFRCPTSGDASRRSRSRLTSRQRSGRG